jgi:Uma2 family endonuclease
MSTQLLTYNDYLALPETMQRYEIIDGNMFIEPTPTIGHQWRLGEVSMQLDAYVMRNRLGLVLYAPVDFIISKAPLRTRQPDLFYISFERLQQYDLDDLEELPYLDVAPELVIEIILPSESSGKFNDKLADYRQIGVQECWLVRSTIGTIEVVKLSNASQTVERFGRGERVQSSVLPEWQPTVDALLVPLNSIKSRQNR